MSKKTLNNISFVLSALLIVAVSGALCYLVYKFKPSSIIAHDHEYCTDIVDRYMTYTRYGDARYWIVYKFGDGCIREFEVSISEYYKAYLESEEE